jgi:hypothetical protein
MAKNTVHMLVSRSVVSSMCEKVKIYQSFQEEGLGSPGVTLPEFKSANF